VLSEAIRSAALMIKSQNHEAVAELYQFGDPFLDPDVMRRMS